MSKQILTLVVELEQGEMSEPDAVAELLAILNGDEEIGGHHVAIQTGESEHAEVYFNDTGDDVYGYVRSATITQEA